MTPRGKRQVRQLEADMVRTERLQLGMTQAAFGAMVGVAARTVQEWEGARRGVPAMLWRLLAALAQVRIQQRLADQLAGMTTDAEMDGDMSGDDAVSTLSALIEHGRQLSPVRPALD